MDYTSFGDGKPAARDPRENPQRRWWILDDHDAAGSIHATLKRMREQQTARLAQFTIAARLYGNLSAFSMGGQAAARYAQQYALMRDRVSYNVVQSAVDTATSKIGKNRPRPYFLTTAGNYTEQRKAQKLNRFIEGVFYEQKAYPLGALVFRDGAVVGDGVTHVYVENKRVRYERVLSTELWVDEMEAIYGNPRQMHRTKLMDRMVLLELASAWSDGSKQQKEMEDAIFHADASKREVVPNDVSDLVEVAESWHLPDGFDPTEKDPKGGAHAISLPGQVLLREPWLRDHFPFARFCWSPRLVGYWSQGGAEQIQQIQFEINKLLGVIQRSFELGGTFTVLLEQSSQVPVEHITNKIGRILRYIGPNAPQVVTPTLVQAEIFQHLFTLKNAAFEQFGISQLSATAQKPAGLNSGKALREYNDIESDRFQTIGKAYEQFFLDLAQLTIEAAQEIKGGYKVQYPGKREVQEIKFDLPSAWVMQCFPVSSLPRDPAGRLQTIQEYMQAGLLSPRQGKKLLDFPDLDHVEDLTNAAENYLGEIFEKMLDGEDYTPPAPEDNLQLAREMALEYIPWARMQRCPEERIELLYRFLDQINGLEQMAAMSAPQPAGAPQASPEPPPTSDLLANEPGLNAAPTAAA